MFWRKWGKAKVKYERILALDLLRGTFMVVIISSHIPWAPSLFSLLGGRGQLFASAAEGFFAISGILVGFIYGPRILKDTKKIFTKIWKRAGMLYILAVVFTLFYTTWAVLSPNTAKYDALYSNGGVSFLIDTFTIHYTFGWTDFLTRYAAFMLVAPFAVWLVAKRKAYIVAIISFLAWFFLRDTEQFLPFAAWQIIFMYGIIVGYYLPNIEAAFQSIVHRKRKLVLGSLWAIGMLSFVGSILWIQIIPYLALNYEWVNQLPVVQILQDALNSTLPYFSKDHVDPGRIAVGIVWFAALYSFFRVYEQRIHKMTRGVLDTLGKNSLFVYGLHAFIIFFIDLYFNPDGQASFIANTLVTALVLVIIYRLTENRGVFKKIRRKLFPSFTKEVIP